jgi:glyoxylase-like metal-dependent hydrolase (beta-lactamase superfamily II)
MSPNVRLARSLAQLAFTVVVACGPGSPEETSMRWCDELPRAANLRFDRVDAGSDWFEVYRVDEGVFALTEPRQFQEAISYLIVGDDRALLFDTGLGMAPIRPVIERLTDRPVVVLNSHTHYDHVGGNAEFDSVLAVDTPYTRANQAGFGHRELAGEAAPSSFCGQPPSGLDTAGFRTRPWTATGWVKDGDPLDLGGRRIEVLAVPGHTPDALALLDRERGLLWTGDTYYDATIWLYVPETDLDAYQRSIARLADLAPSLNRLLPAHNTVAAEPTKLAEAREAIRQVRAGSATGEDASDHRVVFRFDGFSILTSRPLLEGKVGDRSRGGSGLTTWP